jgi:quinol monooxygenase YgiN
MIKRIVKMSFKPENIQAFISVYESNWHHIKGFEGCRHVELLQDEKNAGIFFTYSIWESEEHLNNYRDSEIFAKIWGTTKPMFNAKAEAWTVREVTL